MAIGLAGVAGALFGALGALLVGGEALAALIVFAGTLALSRDRWPAIALGAAVAASLAVSRMSESGADRGEVARKLFGMESGVDIPSAIFNQDTII